MASIALRLPSPLIETVKRGDAVLFLGAGASYGAKRSDGNTIPLGAGLRDLLCDRFLDGLCKDRSLDEVASLAENSFGTGEVSSFVSKSLADFEPPPPHRLLPTFRWKAVFGTNYDLLVEDAYNATQNPLQALKPFYRETGIETELATEPRRVCRGLFGLSHAAIGRCSIMA
jgi:hypothetical protein